MAQNSGNAPSPARFARASPGCGRGERSKVHANSRTSSRGAFMRPSFANHDHAKKDSPPKEGSGAPKGACHPCPRYRKQACAVCATYLLRGCTPFRGAPAFRRSRLRHSPKASIPMAQPQNRVSRRRTELGVLPARPDCLRLSTLRADRSFCRPTGDPEPPGNGVHGSARGDRPLLHPSKVPSRKAPSCEQDERL